MQEAATANIQRRIAAVKEEKRLRSLREMEGGGALNQNRPPLNKNQGTGQRHEEKKNKFFADKKAFEQWKGTTDFCHPSSPLHVLPQFLADNRQKTRLAMILSLSLIDLPQMTVEQRIRQWTSNLIGYLGAGLTHERFRD